MRISNIVFEVASIALVEFESGSNTIAVVRREKLKGALQDAPHWAGAISALMTVAIETIPESDQIEFESILYEKVKEAMGKGEMVIQGGVGEELF